MKSTKYTKLSYYKLKLTISSSIFYYKLTKPLPYKNSLNFTLSRREMKYYYSSLHLSHNP